MEKSTFSKFGAIYKIENILSKKVYIGQSIEIFRRWQKHINYLKRNAHGNEHLQRAWNFYKDETIWIFSILELCNPDKEIMKQREQYWLDFFHASDENFGYNMRPSAASPRGYTFTMSDKGRKKISEALKGKKRPRTAEHQKKLSEALRGKTRSKEHCDNISKAKKGKKHSKPRSEETRAKISKIHKGKVITEEQRKKISLALTGKKRGPHSEEHRRKISDAHKGKKRGPYRVTNKNPENTWI